MFCCELRTESQNLSNWRMQRCYGGPEVGYFSKEQTTAFESNSLLIHANLANVDFSFVKWFHLWEGSFSA